MSLPTVGVITPLFDKVETPEINVVGAEVVNWSSRVFP